ncbi:MAG: hypothetical protein IJI39_06400, partial [Clostridia bacterium]|nr:hypothetical protein [Clostridia bacterium]
AVLALVGALVDIALVVHLLEHLLDAKLAAAAGVEKLENELILIDPKTKPSKENESNLKDFCDKLCAAQ